MNHAPSHTNEIILDYFSNNGIDYIFIPGFLTSILQPLDISVNKPFKTAYKKRYTEFVVFNSKDFFEKVEKPKKEDIIEWVNSIWYSEEIISQATIINGFRKSGISLPSDGSQDDEFKSISINEENEVIDEIVDDINISEKEDL